MKIRTRRIIAIVVAIAFVLTGIIVLAYNSGDPRIIAPAQSETVVALS